MNTITMTTLLSAEPQVTRRYRAECACGVTCKWCRRGHHDMCETGMCKA